MDFACWNGEDIVTSMRKPYIWHSIAVACGEGESAECLLSNDWHDHLSESEIDSAKKEAAKRLKEIDRREADNE